MNRALWVLGWPLRAVMLGLLTAYRRFFGGAFGGRCRFYPSCSSYAQEAIRVHGAAKGAFLAMVRVARCSPLSSGGIDHVPARKPRDEALSATKSVTTSYGGPA